MDAVELGRRKAAALHAQACEKGADPERPFELVQAVAKALGRPVEAYARGAEVLRGARACLDPLSGAILHEETDDLFWQAFLVAHEIGHAVLGDDPDLDGGDIPAFEPERPSEMAPAGEERVIGYGAKTRREV